MNVSEDGRYDKLIAIFFEKLAEQEQCRAKAKAARAAREQEEREYRERWLEEDATEHRSEQTVRYLKITDTLGEILREREIESRGAYIFTRAGGEVTDYYQILRDACEATGVAYGRDAAGGFVTHDARHTAVTRMLQAGRDLATIGSITGHTDKSLILHYGHASTESKDQAMDVLEKFAGNETLGLGLDTISKDGLIYSGMLEALVPEVGLEPT